MVLALDLAPSLVILLVLIFIHGGVSCVPYLAVVFLIKIITIVQSISNPSVITPEMNPLWRRIPAYIEIFCGESSHPVIEHTPASIEAQNQSIRY